MKQIIQAEERLTQLPKTEHYQMSEKEYQEFKQGLREFIQTSTIEQKRTFLANFIRKITVYKENIKISYYPPLQ